MATAKAQLASYVASFLALGKTRLLIVLTLVAIGTLVEGAGILLLIPLLGLVFSGFSAASHSDSGLLSSLQSYLHTMSPAQQLTILLGAFLVLLCVRALITWQRDIQSLRLSQDMVERWRADIVWAVAGANWRQLQEMQNSRLEFAAASEVSRLSAGSDLLLRGTISIVQLVLLVSLALYLSSVLTALVLLCVLVAIPLLLPLVRASHRHGEELSRDGSKRQNVFSELLAGMKLAKTHDAEQRFTDEFITVSDRMRCRALAFASLQIRMRNMFQLAGGIAAAVIVYAGLIWFPTSPALLTSILVLMTRIIGPVQQLAQSAQSLLTMLPAIGNLNDIKAALGGNEIPPSISDVAQPAGQFSEPMGFALHGVAYRPASRENRLFQNLDLEVEAGQLAVLLGPSGSGKTTIADLLLGLIPPDEGVVSVGACSMADPAQRAAARRALAYVPQEPFLFDKSLRENLLWAEPTASEAQLYKALKLAEADEFVRNLPNGLDTRVGNRGSLLSGGERQRVCLARALLRDPGLLIMDEATSALDPTVEDRLLKTLLHLRGKLTLLVIAHRLPKWFSADRYFVLEDGRLRSTAHAGLAANG